MAPLRIPLFRALWTAALISNIGGWMQNVSAAWLMTSLTSSPLVIALVQTATTLPVFLVALPAGALADVVDRRRLLLAMQAWMCLMAAALGIITLAGAVTPWVVLGLTFALGLGAALNAPAWQAVIPEVVPREQLPAAVALNSAGFNVGRAVGPALGGIVVAALGAGTGFLTNAVSFLGVMFVVSRWRPEPAVRIVPAERLVGAVRAGLRYARHDRAVKVVLVRSGAVLISASATWALLPLLARDQLGLSSLGYGVLLGCVGAGAVFGAGVLPWWRRRVGVDALVNGSTLIYAAAMVTVAWATTSSVAAVALLIGGIAWIGLMSTFNTAAQMASPPWAKARVLAMYLLVSQGALAVGSVLWGLVATRSTLTLAMLVAAGALAGTIVLSRGLALAQGESIDRTPSRHWPDPDLVYTPRSDDGPVLVTIEYRISTADADRFVSAMNRIRSIRLRDGATAWGLYRDLADPTRFMENYLVESWAEHLRQHARINVTDREVESEVRAVHIGPGPPKVSHLVAGFGRGVAPSDNG